MNANGWRGRRFGTGSVAACLAGISLAWAVMGSPAGWPQAPLSDSPPSSSSDDVARIRRQLDEFRQAREAREKALEFVGAQPTARTPGAAIERAIDAADGPARRRAWVRLDLSMRTLRAIWTFEPIREADSDEPPGPVLRVPLCIRGEQWLALPPGTWRLALLAGSPGGDEPLRVAGWEVRLRAGQRVELVLDESVEAILTDRLPDANDSRERRISDPDSNTHTTSVH